MIYDDVGETEEQKIYFKSFTFDKPKSIKSKQIFAISLNYSDVCVELAGRS